MRRLKILVGGVPFGRNNVGDEAILECVVRILREAAPSAELTVSTDDGPATARKLGVRTVELFGFAPPYSRERMRRELTGADAFVWAGATGLSDYPEIPVEMLRIARAAGRKTIVWNVGMNDELNPVKYRLLPGARRTALAALAGLTGGLWDAVGWEERRRAARAERAIAAALGAADLVVVRDPESRDRVLQCGPGLRVEVGADSALILEPAPLPALPEEAARLLAFEGPKIGVCISAQRKIGDTDRLTAYLDRLVEDGRRRVLFIPMNPVTDAELMGGLRRSMKRPERAAVLEGRFEPGEILAAAAKMDLILSSRLHLIILASIVHTPFIGVSRGSKVDNFLRQYGLASAGSVERCDFEALWAETERLLAGKADFAARSRVERERLLARLAAARARLEEILR